MPHKHKLPKGQRNDNEFNLPPSSIAKPLKTSKVDADAIKARKDKKKKSRRVSKGFGDDDTPKAFQRLMAFQKDRKAFGHSGLKTRKDVHNEQLEVEADAPNLDEETETNDTNVALSTVRIMPGEGLGDFAARVDKALPVSGLAKKGGSGRKTRLEKKMQRMQAEWRQEDSRRKERLEEQLEELTERQEDDMGLALPSASVGLGRRKKRKDDSDEDIWAKVEPRRFNDVAQAPPTLDKKPKSGKLMAKVEHVPRISGSLRKREELGLIREDVLESYRRLMESKRQLAS